MADGKGYYATLGVPERASQLEIKKAYRRLARKYHPDRNGTSHAEDMIKKINAAYEVLSDVHKRDLYDRSSFGDVSGGTQEQEDGEGAHVQEQRHHHHYRQHYEEGEGGGNGHGDSGDGYAAEADQQQPRSKKSEAKRDASDNNNSNYYGGPTYIETPKGRFHIIVEPSLCMAFGSCETLAPKVFVVEKNKRVNPKARVESEAGADYETIHAAAQMCPTKAIRIIDRYTGEQLFP